MLTHLRNLLALANCDHPMVERYCIYSTGAEIHLCTRCGRVAQILANGRVTEPLPTALLPRLRLMRSDVAEDYRGDRLPMED